MGELEHMLTINLKDESFRMVRALFLSEYSTMVSKNFQIYSVQITGKCILWNSFPLVCSDH